MKQAVARVCVWFSLALPAGCAGLSPAPPAADVGPAPQVTAPRPAPGLLQVGHQELAPPADAPLPPPAAPFAGAEELSEQSLVEQVLLRNPSLAQMVAAWQAASARPAQVSSLDDPMVGVSVAPGAFGSNKVQ